MDNEEHDTERGRAASSTTRLASRRVAPPEEFERLAEALRDRFAFIHIS